MVDAEGNCTSAASCHIYIRLLSVWPEFTQLLAVQQKGRADLWPGPSPPRGVSACEAMATGVDGESRPASCSSRCLGFFDSFFSGLQASCGHVMTSHS